MGQDNCHNAIRFKMEQVVEQECVICFTLRSHAIIGITRIMLLVLSRLPMLRIRRIRNYSINVQRGINMLFIKERPVLFECVAITCHDIVRKNTTHDQVHTGKVISVFFKLLGIILDIILAAHMFCGALTNIDKQRTGTTRRVVNLNLVTIAKMISHDLRHQQGNLVRRIELASLLTSICGKVTDEIFINEAENVIVFFAVHRDILNQLKQVADCLGSCTRSITELRKAGV